MTIPELCPLCNKDNACLNLSDEASTKTCWCMNPKIQFPEALLTNIPDSQKGKACIRQACATKFSANKSKENPVDDLFFEEKSGK